MPLNARLDDVHLTLAKNHAIIFTREARWSRKEEGRDYYFQPREWD
jgi:hypothetical protein